MTFTDPNARIFYACQAILVVERNTATGNTAPNHASSKWLSGVQSIGVTRDAQSSSIPDIGRFQQQFHYYGQQSIEITIERLIDQDADFFYHVDPDNYGDATAGYKKSHLLYEDNISVDGQVDPATASSKCLKNYDISLIYTPDKFSRVGIDARDASGDSDPDRAKLMIDVFRNCLLTNITYNIGVDGAVRESITLFTKFSEKVTDLNLTNFLSSQLPAADTGSGVPSAESGNVLKGRDIKFREPDLTRYDGTALRRQNSDSSYISILPDEAELMFDLSNQLNGLRITGVSSIEINLTLNYSDVTDVGRWTGSHTSSAGHRKADNSVVSDDVFGQGLQNLWRFVTFPVEISTSIVGTARQDFPQTIPNDGTFFTRAANFNSSLGKPTPTSAAPPGPGEPEYDGVPRTYDWNRVDRPILITALKENNSYFIWDLGEHNYLTNMSVSGGDTGGGNVQISMSYQNDFSEAVFAKHTAVKNLVYDGPY